MFSPTAQLWFIFAHFLDAFPKVSRSYPWW